MARRRPTPEHVPTALPILQRGSHADPDDGACFMEFASVLAGERFTDRPHCTHPVLAAVARAVNDTVGDTTRQSLLPLVPSVVGAGRGDLRLGPRLVALCTARAIGAQRAEGVCFAGGCSGDRCAHRQWLRSAHRRAQRRLAALDQHPGARGVRGLLTRVRMRAYDTSAEHVISLAVSVLAKKGEDAAVMLLRDCLGLLPQVAPAGLEPATFSV